MPDKLTVFLCHASLDKPKVREIRDWLVDKGFAPWIDEANLLPGSEWRVEIKRAIATCDIFLVLLSSNSITKRGFVQAEIRCGLDELLNVPTGQVFVVPAKLEACDLPENLSHLHAVDISSDLGRTSLVDSLNAQAERLGRANKTPQQEKSLNVARRVEALEFAIATNDGQSPELAATADILLVGLSRTGKSSVCLHLASTYRILAANYTVVTDDFKRGALPKRIKIENEKILGLTVPPESLSQIRQNRRPGSEYASLQRCELECLGFENLMHTANIETISIDAATISLEDLVGRIGRIRFPLRQALVSAEIELLRVFPGTRQ